MKYKPGDIVLFTYTLVVKPPTKGRIVSWEQAIASGWKPHPDFNKEKEVLAFWEDDNKICSADIRGVTLVKRFNERKLPNWF